MKMFGKFNNFLVNYKKKLFNYNKTKIIKKA